VYNIVLLVQYRFYYDTKLEMANAMFPEEPAIKMERDKGISDGDLLRSNLSLLMEISKYPPPPFPNTYTTYKINKSDSLMHSGLYPCKTCENL
jgi:hypothetical protein